MEKIEIHAVLIFLPPTLEHIILIIVAMKYISVQHFGTYLQE